MLFTVEELSLWLGLTQFEILTQTFCTLLFTVLVVIRVEFSNRLDFVSTPEFWVVFSPLFAANVVNAYFCVIVFIRTCLERTFKAAMLRAIWSATVIGTLMISEYWLCQKLLGNSTSDYTEVLMPLVVLVPCVALRGCQIR